MAIEITPRVQIKELIFPIIFLSVVVVVLLGLFASYFYFTISSKNISETIQKKEVDLVKTSSEKLLENEMLLQESRINTFKGLLTEHRRSLNIFNFMEDVTHPDVLFTQFDLDTVTGAVNVSGTAKSFISLEQQLIILKGQEALSKVNLSEISIGEEGGVSFALQLTFGFQIFK